MAIATWELQTDRARRHPAGTRRVAAASVARPSPVRRPAPPTAERARAATRGAATARLRRGLALLAFLVIAAVGVVSVLGGSPADAAAAQALEDAAPVISAVVGPGDTVWDLALPHVPVGTHPQVFVEEVLAANGLEAASVVPGTVVRIPQG